jgi:isopenicillin N synthase-like dioxygenase
MAPLLHAAPGSPAHDSAVDALGAGLERFAVVQLVGHGVDPALRARLHRAAEEFFALPEAEKRRIAMARAGAAWRGWFAVGEELTDGVPDDKEGLYLGTELAADHPAVRAGRPLHGPNLFPRRPAGLRDAALAWMDRVAALAGPLLRAVATWIGEPPDHFDRWFADPVVLFRLFHSPPPPPGFAGDHAVGGHTDYGGLTLLAQDGVGGLEVRLGPEDGGRWVPVPPVDDALVCNLGDMVAGMTGGRLRAGPHRVLLPGRDRYSFPLFVDPSWDARIPGVAGTYGEALLARVAPVFPDLFRQAIGDARVR